jgi:hypothetical protein
MNYNTARIGVDYGGLRMYGFCDSGNSKITMAAAGVRRA